MKTIALIITAALLGACATSHQEERVNAVKDFIEVNDLPEAESIRTFDRLDQKELNDHFIIVSSRREHYLIEYNQRCIEVRDRGGRVDKRGAGSKHGIEDRLDGYFKGCGIGEEA